MFWLIFGIVAVVILFYYVAVKPMNYWIERGVKQGNPVWFFGDNWGIICKKENFVDLVQKSYDALPGVRYSGMYQLTSPMLMVKDLELIKLLTVKDFDHFMDHSAIFPENDRLLGKNLFSLKGKKWRNMRPILSPSFTSSKMKAMFILISECARTFTDFFLKKDEDTLELEMRDAFTRFANDVIASTAFGIKIDSLEEPENQFYLMGKDATDFTGFKKTIKLFGNVLWPKLFEVFDIEFFDENISNFFIELIDRTIKNREKNGTVRADMLQLLIEARKGIQHKEEKTIDTGFAVVDEADLGKGEITEMTNLDIAAQAMIFFFAGFDSSSSLMCFMAYELMVNPDIQKTLREEIENTSEDCHGTPTYEAILKMKYMDMVICETLRKWPNVIASDRVCTKPYVIPPVTPDETRLEVEKGTLIAIPTWALQRDPKYFPDPDRFDPERFSEENKKNINPYTYLPFGIGPRNCIGSRFALLETKIVFFHLLSNFELVPIARSQIPIQLSKKSLSLIAEDGFWVGMKKLKTEN